MVCTALLGKRSCPAKVGSKKKTQTNACNNTTKELRSYFVDLSQTSSMTVALLQQ